MMTNKSAELLHDLKVIGEPCGVQVRLPRIARGLRPSAVSVPQSSTATKSDQLPSITSAPKPSTVRHGKKLIPHQENAHVTALQYRRGNDNLCWSGHKFYSFKFDEPNYYCNICLLDIPCGSEGLACEQHDHYVCSACTPASKCPLDLPTAWNLLNANADEGHMKSQFLVGRVLELGEYADPPVFFGCHHRKSLRRAIERYLQSARQGYTPAIHSLGSCFLDRPNTGDWILMLDWECMIMQLFRRWAALHNPAAQYILGICYYQGCGVEHDFSSATHWLQLAAAKGYNDAVIALEQIGGRTVVIDRNDVLGGSLRHFNRVTDEELCEYEVNVVFQGEAGVDGGGLFNEWLTLLTPRLFCAPLFLPVIEKDCITPLIRLNPLPFPFFSTADECRQHLRLIGIVLGLSVQRGVPLGVRLSSGFCKALLGQSPCFDDLQTELPDEHEWMKGGLRNLDTEDESCSRKFVTPSREVQVWQSIVRLRQTDTRSYDDMLRLFEQRCLGHSGPLDDDESSANIACMCCVEHDCALSSSNFQHYVQSVVQKQLVLNYHDTLPTILSAFQNIVNLEDGGYVHTGIQDILAGSTALHASEIIDVWKSFSSWNPKAKVVKWFWELLSEATHEYRIQVFQWSSGRTVFPVHVPDDLRYEIEVDPDAQKLPTTHTCFGLGQITLPTVKTKESLKQKLDWCLQSAQAYGYA